MVKLYYSYCSSHIMKIARSSRSHTSISPDASSSDDQVPEKIIRIHTDRIGPEECRNGVRLIAADSSKVSAVNVQSPRYVKLFPKEPPVIRLSLECLSVTQILVLNL